MEREYSYKEHDQQGEETLLAISEADKFNRWMYNTISRYCKGKILEIGSGIGNISYFFLQDNHEIHLSDIRENYRQKLQDQFSKFNPTVVDIDIAAEDFELRYKDLLGTYDTVFSLNVIEHIKDDNFAINNCRKLLSKNGRLITLVPAYEFLYNGFDKELEHYRRYNRKKLRILYKDKFKIMRTWHFNVAGMAGWFISGSVLRKKIIPSEQMNLYNKLVPLFKLIDKLLLNQIGLSVLIVGEKNEDR